MHQPQPSCRCFVHLHHLSVGHFRCENLSCDSLLSRHQCTRRSIINLCRNTPSSCRSITKKTTSPPFTTGSKPSWSRSERPSSSFLSTTAHATVPTVSSKRSPL